ncbi:hypothetical protein GOEFS_105_00790 [Gordonia effusa NBRC 100432]|uniref:Uncharacterized protein n=1 Tax=Gordonia effusa NBRC 100432 TaxID=1077974 RepID=H0R4R7_9ACTN|nr:hypothetical protein [Gordonia effusa]GAB20068.1 hypothetical protein GOEFS_105_00790 [Gordonia effusa NBRC 100432]
MDVDFNLFEALIFWFAIGAISTAWIWLPLGTIVLVWVSRRRFRTRRALFDQGVEPRFACMAASKSLWCWIIVVVATSLFGAGLFGGRVWIAFAVLATVSLVVGALLLVSGWSTRSVGTVVIVLGLVQATQTYLYGSAPSLGTDAPSIPVDNYVVALLCTTAAILLATEPPWPATDGIRRKRTGVAGASNGPGQGL